MVTYESLEICKKILDKEKDELDYLEKNIKKTVKKKIQRYNLIKIIEIIRNNKYIFKSLGHVKLYNKLLKEFYSILETLIKINSEHYQENYYFIHKNINTIEKLNISIYLEDIIENIPGLEILIYHYNNSKSYHTIDLNDDVLIEKYKLQKTPVLKPEYKDNITIISYISFLLNIFNSSYWSAILQKIISIIIFDFMCRHFYFLEQNEEFALTVKKKVEEFYIKEKKCLIKEKSFKTILFKYYDDINIMDHWIIIFNKNFKNNAK